MSLHSTWVYTIPVYYQSTNSITLLYLDYYYLFIYCLVLLRLPGTWMPVPVYHSMSLALDNDSIPKMHVCSTYCSTLLSVQCEIGQSDMFVKC